LVIGPHSIVIFIYSGEKMADDDYDRSKNYRQ